MLDFSLDICVFDHPAALLVVDRQSLEVLDISRSAALLLGVPQKKIIGRPLSRFCFSKAGFAILLSLKMGKGEAEPMRLRLGVSADKAIPVRILAGPPAKHERFKLLCHLEAERAGPPGQGSAVSLEAELERTRSVFSCMTDAVRRLARTGDADDAFDVVCLALAPQNGYSVAWMARPNADPNAPVEVVACAGVAAGILEEIVVRSAEVPEGNGPTGKTLRIGCAHVVNDFEHAADQDVWREIVLKWDIHSAFSVPVFDRDGAVEAALTVYSSKPFAFEQRERAALESLALDLGNARAAVQDRERTKTAEEGHRAAVQARLHSAAVQGIMALSRAHECRDSYTGDHQQRVSYISALIGARMGYTGVALEGLKLGALIHDIGKIAIPAEVLANSGLLSDIEMTLMRTHAQHGYEIVKDLDVPWPVARIIYEHHERLDGSGYPRGLKGKAISDEARIVAVADVFDAMTAHRPYRAALGTDMAMDELLKGRGVRYDARAVDCLKAILLETPELLALKS